jgi:suppressor of ftsI
MHAEPDGGREVISINGQMNPVVEVRPGEKQFWRIANIEREDDCTVPVEGVTRYAIATAGPPCVPSP